MPLPLSALDSGHGEFLQWLAEWQTLQRFAPAGSIAEEDASACTSERPVVLTPDCASPKERTRPSRLKNTCGRICLPLIRRQSKSGGPDCPPPQRSPAAQVPTIAR